jgi:undecaprenyl-diphosphatase
MSTKKKNLAVSAILIMLAVVFTILVKVVDVRAIGPNDSSVGFATINQFVFDTIGVNMLMYHITDWLGFVPIIIAIAYVVIGFIQLIKRKSFAKVDKELFVLGLFYVVVFAIYIFFEKCIVNYRPILMDGFLEASYPSSHTLLSICLSCSAIIINRKLFNNKFTNVLNIILCVIMTVIVVGRLISGVHWFTDILGGLFISMALLMLFYTIINLIKKD